jgi:hypothetical protein
MFSIHLQYHCVDIKSDARRAGPAAATGGLPRRPGVNWRGSGRRRSARPRLPPSPHDGRPPQLHRNFLHKDRREPKQPLTRISIRIGRIRTSPRTAVMDYYRSRIEAEVFRMESQWSTQCAVRPAPPNGSINGADAVPLPQTGIYCSSPAHARSLHLQAPSPVHSLFSHQRVVVAERRRTTGRDREQTCRRRSQPRRESMSPDG